MKVLFCSEGSRRGGAGTYINQMRQLFEDLTVYSDRLGSSNNTKVNYILAIFYLIRILRKENVEFVLFQSTYGLFCSIIVRLFFPKLKIINIYHGLASSYHYKLIFIIEKLSAVVASKLVITNLTDGRKIGFRRKQTYIPNCAINSKYCDAADPKGPIVTVTRRSPQKNNTTLKKFAEISERNIEIFAPQEQHTYFTSKLPTERVSVSFSDVKSQIYFGKSIFILSTHSEGFPLSILEAANFGLPIVVSDIPVLRSLLQENALYFNSAEKLFEITETLIENNSFFHERVEASARLSEQFSFRIWSDRWHALIAEKEL